MIIPMMLGILWGSIEAIFGGFLHASMMGSVAGYILGSLGMFILYYGWRKKLKYHQIILIGIITACFKLLSAVIFPTSIFSPHIIRPVISILTQSFAFTFSVMFIDDALMLFKNNLKLYSPLKIPVLGYLKCAVSAIIIALAIVK